MRPDTSLERRIRAQISRAAERLGAEEDEMRAVPRDKLYDTLEALGADRFLLAIVGSWGDCASEAETLAHLERWNAGGPGLDEVYASTSD